METTTKDGAPRSLGEALPIEMARVRQVIATYQALPGGAGMIGAALMEQSLQRADQAVIGGDLIGMIRAYEELKGIDL